MQLRVTSSPSFSTTVTATLTINGVSGAFMVTTQSASQATISTSLDTPDNPSVVSQTVTFTATVTGNGPTGTVTFSNGALVLCAAVPLAIG